MNVRELLGILNDSRVDAYATVVIVKPGRHGLADENHPVGYGEYCIGWEHVDNSELRTVRLVVDAG